jgi:D-xylulose reductase
MMQFGEVHNRILTRAFKNPSFVLEKAGSVKYEDRDVPEIEDPHDCIVRVKYTGICGSDVHYYTDGAIGSMVVKEPMVLGHESSGIIDSVGSAVKTLKPGDRVAMEPGIPCRRCDWCKKGRYNLCPDMVFAATPPFHGTLAAFYRLPEDFCYKLEDHISLEEGAVVEPLSIAVHTVKQAGLKMGDTVVVFGAGPVGLLCCMVAKAFGATTVVAVDIVQGRLDFAKKYAKASVFNPPKAAADENAKKIIEENGLDSGADVAIDASGAEPSIQTAVHVLRRGGTFVQTGMGKPEVTFPVATMLTKELTVKGSFRYCAGDYFTAVELLATKRISVTELITGKVPFNEAEKAFKAVQAGKGIKTLIEGVED